MSRGFHLKDLNLFFIDGTLSHAIGTSTDLEVISKPGKILQPAGYNLFSVLEIIMVLVKSSLTVTCACT